MMKTTFHLETIAGHHILLMFLTVHSGSVATYRVLEFVFLFVETSKIIALIFLVNNLNLRTSLCDDPGLRFGSSELVRPQLLFPLLLLIMDIAPCDRR